MKSSLIAICSIAIALAGLAGAASLMPDMGSMMSTLPLESMNPASILGSGNAEPEDASDFAKRGLLAAGLPLASFASSETKDIPLAHSLLKRDDDESLNLELDSTNDLQKRKLLASSSPLSQLLKSETGTAPLTQGLLKREMLSRLPGTEMLSALPMGGLPGLGSVIKRDLLSNVAPTELLGDSLGSLSGFKKVRRASSD